MHGGQEKVGMGAGEESTRHPIVQARDLVKLYGDLRAVDTVSFTVMPGEIFGFLGPNGAGKTTTLRMIQCVSPLTGGSLSVFGMDVRDHPAEIKRWLGVVPQETNLDPDFTCRENLLVYARYFDIPAREARERAETLLGSCSSPKGRRPDRGALRRDEEEAHPSPGPRQQPPPPRP